MNKKKKKIIARIGAIVACVLLVGSLVIPAFAAYDESVPWPPTAAFKTAFRAHYLPDDMNTGTLLNLENYMGERFWIADTLIGGKIGAYSMNAATAFSYQNDLRFTEPCTWAFSAPGYSMTESGRMELYFNLRWVQIYLYDANYTHAFTIQYWMGQNDGVPFPSLESIRDEINGTDLTITDTMYLYFAFPTQSVYPDLINEFMFNTTVLHPEAFYRGFTNAYNSSFDSAYDEGYSQGITDAGDGTFGRNFFGAIFRAPFEALNNFTLIEWTTDAGATISISLATIVSAGIGIALFIWFLKLFAGG